MTKIVLKSLSNSWPYDHLWAGSSLDFETYECRRKLI